MWVKCVLLCLFFLHLTNCANILFVATLYSPSHYLWNKVLSLGLTQKGHNVTMLTHSQEKDAIKDFHVITMEGYEKFISTKFDMLEFSEEKCVLKLIKYYYDYGQVTCEYDATTKGFQTLLNYPKDYKFDMVIYDVTVNQCFYPLTKRFHATSAIGVTAFLLPPVFSNAFGNHLYTSYMPYFNTMYTNKMDLMERIYNYIYLNADVLYRKFIATRAENKIAKRLFGEDTPDLEEFERNMTLLLSNTDPILDYPVPLPPNIIPVGGLQIKPGKPLPDDLKKIVDEAKHGIILFSLGTNIRSDQLKLERRQAFLDAFSRLPQVVFWKFETDDIQGLPKNVYIRKWLPQNDILAHPKTKLFISHAGALSIQEAMYHGVPMVVIPFIVDQYNNAGKMERRGIAKYLDKSTLTPDNIYNAVSTVLNNPSYTKTVKEISIKYKDRPQTALERAIFWVEYVIRHGTAEHLVTPARDMPQYQLLNLDVLFVFVLGVFLAYSILLFLFTICRFLFTFLFRAKKIANK